MDFFFLFVEATMKRGNVVRNEWCHIVTTYNLSQGDRAPTHREDGRARVSLASFFPPLLFRNNNININPHCSHHCLSTRILNGSHQRSY
jgi:hypothetical protein